MGTTLKNSNESDQPQDGKHLELDRDPFSCMRSSIPEWVENTQAMMVFNVSKRTLQNWRDRGLLGFSKIGSKIYYSREDINRFLHKHSHQPFK